MLKFQPIESEKIYARMSLADKKTTTQKRGIQVQHPLKRKLTAGDRLKKPGLEIIQNRWLYVLILPAPVYLIIFNYLPMYGVQIAQRGIRRREFGRFIHSLEALPEMVTEFSEELWGSLVDHVTVHSKDNIVFTLTNGMEIKA